MGMRCLLSTMLQCHWSAPVASSQPPPDHPASPSPAWAAGWLPPVSPWTTVQFRRQVGAARNASASSTALAPKPTPCQRIPCGVHKLILILMEFFDNWINLPVGFESIAMIAVRRREKFRVSGRNAVLESSLPKLVVSGPQKGVAQHLVGLASQLEPVQPQLEVVGRTLGVRALRVAANGRASVTEQKRKSNG